MIEQWVNGKRGDIRADPIKIFLRATANLYWLERGNNPDLTDEQWEAASRALSWRTRVSKADARLYPSKSLAIEGHLRSTRSRKANLEEMLGYVDQEIRRCEGL